MTSRLELNEFVFNHVGTDTNEYIEVEGPANTDLSAYSLVVLDGDGTQAGVVDNVFKLGTTDASGYWWTGYLNNQLQNGSQTLLLVKNNTATVNQKLDPNHDGVLDTVPWSSVADSVAVTDGDAGDQVYSTVVLTPNYDGQNGTVGGASRIPDGQNTGTTADWERNDFNLAGLPGKSTTPAAGDALNTPDTANQGTATTTTAPTPASLTIQQINGPSYESPYGGKLVATSGIVTALDTTGSIGFWVQDPNPASSGVSSAIFVFTGTTTGLPAVGDAVSVSGTVSNYLPGGSTNNLAIPEVTSPTVTVGTHNNALPAAVIIGQNGRLPPATTVYGGTPGNLNQSTAPLDPAHNGLDFYRSLLGMRVQVQNAVVVGATDAYGDTWVLSDNGAANTSPDPRGGILQSPTSDNAQRIQVVPDTGVLPGFNPGLSKVGDTLGNVTGVLSYDFGEFEVVPTQAYTPVDGGLAQQTTTFAGDARHLLVADYNVENFSAQSGARINQLAGIIANNLNRPDVLALQEIQDNDGPTDDGVTDASQTAQALINAIRTLTGITYAYADIPPANDTSGGQPGGNIRVAFLYNPARVTLVPGSLRQVTDTTDGNAFASSRLPLVGDFLFNGQVVTLISVHDTSKSGSTEQFGAVQPPVNYGDAQRQAQATVISNYVRNLLSANPAAKVGVLGDFNDFDTSAAQQIFTGGSSPVLTDLNTLEPANARYTYDFEGQSESLDHTLGTAALLQASQFQTVHVNAEFPDSTRESDHDPSLTLVTLDAAPCFTPGTLIRTDTGERAVETLEVGDLVETTGGVLRRVRWIGRRAYAGRFVRGRRDILPVTIRAGALADGVPARDLTVSPLHAMLLDGVLVPAGLLVNGSTVVQAQRVERVEYLHVELDTHDVIWAEGAAAESYVDDDNRSLFGNAASFRARILDAKPGPAVYCAPRVEDGPTLEAIRRRLSARAAARAA